MEQQTVAKPVQKKVRVEIVLKRKDQRTGGETRAIDQNSSFGSVI